MSSLQVMHTAAPKQDKTVLVILEAGPVYYKVPLYRKLAQRSDIVCVVLYYDDFWRRPTEHKDFGTVITLDYDFYDGYRYKILKNFSLRKTPSAFWGCLNLDLPKILRKIRPDAVMINGYMRASDLIGLTTAWVYGVPVIFRGEADLRKRTSPVKRFIKRIVLPVIFRGCAAVLYSCEANKEYYRNYGVPEEKLFFVPSAVDNDFFRSEAEKLQPLRERIRKELGVPSSAVVITYVGSLVARKRPMDLLEAFIRLSMDNAWLLFVGTGPEKAVLEERIRNYGIERIVFAGFANRSEISRYYVVSDVLVVASEYDPSPKVINEAMNFGLPIIASDRVGTAGDLVISGENGFVYPVGDIDALTHCLRRLCEDAVLRRQMGARSLEIVAEWSVEKQVEGVLAALEYIEKSRRR